MQFMDAEDKRSRCGTGECVLHLAQSKTPSTGRRSSYGTWEASSPPRAASLGQVRKGKTHCVDCGVAILQRTADRHDGRCVPCHREAEMTPPAGFDLPRDLK